MKKFIYLISIFLFFYSCDSNSSSGPSATPVTVVSLSVSNLDSDFATNTDKQNAFKADLATELGITDLNRVQILSITTPTRASFIIELLFLEPTTTSGPSVADLLNSITDLEQIGNYAIEEFETSLSDNMASVEYLLEAANTTLENILSDMYTCTEMETCDSDNMNFEPAYNLYMEVLNYDSNHSGANFGAGLTEMLTITQDPLLEEIIEKWDGWNSGEIFPETSRSGGTGRGYRKVNVASFNSGIPMGLDAFLMPKNIDFTSFLPIEYLFNYYVSQENLEHENGFYRNLNETTMMSDFMNIIDNVFLARLTSSIAHLEKVVDKDYVFNITPAMQGNSNQQLLEMDDTEFHLLMASMHAMRYMLYSISAIDLDIGINFDEDPQDFEFLEKNSDFLTLRDGKENYLPNAHAEITALLTSLTAAYDFLANDVDTSTDITLWSDVSGGVIELDDNESVDLGTFISPVEGGTIFDIFNTNQTIELCDANCDQECDSAYNNVYNSWYNDYYYACECYTSQGSYTINNVYQNCENIDLSLKNFMTNPPNNLKDILPDYSVTTIPDYHFDMSGWKNEKTDVILDLSGCSIDCNMIDGNCDNTYYTSYSISGNSSYYNQSSGWTSSNTGSQYLTSCTPINNYLQDVHNNLNTVIFDSSIFNDVNEWYGFSPSDIYWDGSISAHLVEDLGNNNYRVSLDLDYWGAWIDDDMESCIEWSTSDFTTWKSQWDITIGGLFPNMQNGFFFDTFLSVDDDDILDDCSE